MRYRVFVPLRFAFRLCALFNGIFGRLYSKAFRCIPAGSVARTRAPRQRAPARARQITLSFMSAPEMSSRSCASAASYGLGGRCCASPASASVGANAARRSAGVPACASKWLRRDDAARESEPREGAGGGGRAKLLHPRHTHSRVRACAHTGRAGPPPSRTSAR